MQGERKRGRTEALPAFCQKAVLSWLVKAKGTRNRYTISIYCVFPKQRTNWGAD